jgi:hypothetical protein
MTDIASRHRGQEPDTVLREELLGAQGAHYLDHRGREQHDEHGQDEKHQREQNLDRTFLGCLFGAKATLAAQ